MTDGIIRLEIPKFGLSMEEGTVTRWLLEEGDSFAAGTDIAEIESSKIANVLEAHTAGILRRKLVAEGDSLPVGGLIGVAADQAVSDEEIDAYLAQSTAASGSKPEGTISNAPAPPAEASPAVSKDTAQVESSRRPAPDTTATTSQPAPGRIVIPESLSLGEGEVNTMEVPLTRHAAQLAERHRLDLSRIPGSGRRGRVSVADIREAVVAEGGSLPRPERPAENVPGSPSTADDSAVRATPLARKLAREAGVNLNDVPLTGDRGRVTKAAVLAVLRSREQTVAGGMEGTAVAPEAQGGPAFRVLPFSATRRTIADRLQASKQTSPHFRVSSDVRVDELLRLRDTLNAELPEARVSINDLVVKACACALQELPHCNVQYVADELRGFERVDIAVAVATKSGLITPVVRDVGSKTLLQLSSEVRSLATQAKAGQLRLEDIEGGTFTVSNLGMYGVRNFDAIINPPQSAILAVGAIRREPVVDGDQLAIGSLVNLTLSSDHRILDGAVAAELLGRLRFLLSNPALMLA
ncbi:MAG: 2-oxo acid dehydrogenase subunit E2 [Haliea sp.]|uniref:2-oxo acid dehydrogenase subunit E2 n=1 Tax=Haliea sp. TaxID=1932666 RepID=UPI0032EFDEFB